MQNEGQDEFNMHRWMYLCVCVCVCFNKVPTAMEYLEIKNVGYKTEIHLFIYLLTHWHC